MKTGQQRLLQAINTKLCIDCDIQISPLHQHSIGTNSGIPIIISAKHYHHKITSDVVAEELGWGNVKTFSQKLGINENVFLENVAAFVQSKKDSEENSFSLAGQCIKKLKGLKDQAVMIITHDSGKHELDAEVTEPLLVQPRNHVDEALDFLESIKTEEISAFLTQVRASLSQVQGAAATDSASQISGEQFAALQLWCQQSLTAGKMPAGIRALSWIPALISFASVGIPCGIYAGDALSETWAKAAVGIPAWLAVSFLCGNGNKSLFDGIFASMYNMVAGPREKGCDALNTAKKTAILTICLILGWVSAGGAGEFAIKALLNGDGKQGWSPKEFCDAIRQAGSCEAIYKIVADTIIGLSYVFPMLGNTGYFASYPGFLQKTAGRFFSSSPTLPANDKELRHAVKQMLSEEIKKIKIEASRQEIKEWWGKIFGGEAGPHGDFEKFLALIEQQPHSVAWRSTAAKVVDAGAAVTNTVLATLGTYYYFLNGLQGKEPSFWNDLYSAGIWALNAVISQRSLQGVYDRVRHELDWKAILPMLGCLAVATPAITATFQQNIEVGSPIPALASSVVSQGGLTVFAFFSLFWPKSHRDQMADGIETLLAKVDRLPSAQLKELYGFLMEARNLKTTAAVEPVSAAGCLV